MSHIIAIANQKGGVGKTTTAVNLSACLAAARRHTLLIDMDPQGNATSGLGIDKHSIPVTVYDLLLDSSCPLDKVILNPLFEDLFLIPGNIQLIGAEVELLNSPEKENRLRRMVDAVRDKFDYIIIDAPPSLGLLTINVLTAADALIVPVQCEYYALEGLSLLMETTRRVRHALNPGLYVLGLLVTMYDSRTNLARQVTDDVRSHFGNLVFDTIISRTVRLSESPSFGQPIILYDFDSVGAQRYLRFTREVLSRLEHKEGTTPEHRDDDNVIHPPPLTQEAPHDEEEKEGPGTRA